MSLKAFNSGCNAVAYQKNGKNYAMCCAWAQMINYDLLTMLLGSQSVTGNNIQVGDVIGVSGLASEQLSITEALGEGHSDTTDKLKNIKYHTNGTAVLIDGAKTNLVCKVIDIIHKDYIEGDNLIVLQVLKEASDSEKTFLAH